MHTQNNCYSVQETESPTLLDFHDVRQCFRPDEAVYCCLFTENIHILLSQIRRIVQDLS